MTEECNCLPLKQILNCPFETSESMLFFQNFVRTGFTAQETYWPALESLGKRAGQPGVSFQWLHTNGLSPWSKLFPSLPSTQDFVPAGLGHAVCYPWPWGGCQPGREELPIRAPPVLVLIGSQWALRPCTRGVPALLASELGVHLWSASGQACWSLLVTPLRDNQQ